MEWYMEMGTENETPTIQSNLFKSNRGYTVVDRMEFVRSCDRNSTPIRHSIWYEWRFHWSKKLNLIWQQHERETQQHKPCSGAADCTSLQGSSEASDESRLNFSVPFHTAGKLAAAPTRTRTRLHSKGRSLRMNGWHYTPTKIKIDGPEMFHRILFLLLLLLLQCLVMLLLQFVLLWL